jgi:hypothetical protein
MLLVFAVTLFVSAALLFLVQPMVGKLLLPYLGGTPAVWNTCMVFFQTLLLVGYCYAHLLSRFALRRQVVVHSIVMLLPLAPLLLLRFNVGQAAALWPAPLGEDATFKLFGWLLVVLLLLVGLPFFVVSTSAPLLQKWFAGTDAPSARDPYFLYAASNLGSMLGLIGYVVYVEPRFPLTERAGLLTWPQTWLWTVGYVGLVGLTALCGLTALGRRLPSADVAAREEAAPPERIPTVLRRFRWILLAFIPNSQMLGVTTYMTTDITPMPLLWVLPLALYLLSFILVFSFLRRFLQPLMTLLLPFAVVAVALQSDWVRLFDLHVHQRLALHLAALFVTAMVCHGELARTRPSTRYLTEFYLLMSLGGVLGGLFNALLAPIAFNRVWEYPLILALPCLMMPGFGVSRGTPARALELVFGSLLAVFGVAAGAFLVGKVFVEQEQAHKWVKDNLGDQGPLSALTPAANWVADRMAEGEEEKRDEYGVWIRRTKRIYQERNFFGYFSVDAKEFNPKFFQRGGLYHKMYHGTTTHGMQWMEKGRHDEPLTFFHRQGPVGQLFDAVYEKAGGDGKQSVAILGVGAGTLAAYAKKDWRLTLFEIDPAVVRMATNTDYFTYLSDAKSRGASVEVKMGDGRLMLDREEDGAFDLLFMDAFNSDSVPIHLLTKEAFEIYKKKLKPNGLLVVNISNRYLDFETVLGNLAEATDMEALIQYGLEDRSIDQYGCIWVVLARKTEKDQAFGILPQLRDHQRRWQKPETDPRQPVWTDDYSNLLAIFNWYRS